MVVVICSVEARSTHAFHCIQVLLFQLYFQGVYNVLERSWMPSKYRIEYRTSWNPRACTYIFWWKPSGFPHCTQRQPHHHTEAWPLHCSLPYEDECQSEHEKHSLSWIVALCHAPLLESSFDIYSVPPTNTFVLWSLIGESVDERSSLSAQPRTLVLHQEIIIDNFFNKYTVQEQWAFTHTNGVNTSQWMCNYHHYC